MNQTPSLVFGNGEIGIMVYPREVVLVPIDRRAVGSTEEIPLTDERWGKRVSLSFLSDESARLLIESIEKCLTAKPVVITWEARVVEVNKEGT